MGSLSNFMENELLDHVFGCGDRDFTPDSIIYLGVSRSAPLDDASGISEPSDAAYIRVPTDSSYWDVASGGSLQNALAITFSDATDSWGDLSDVMLMRSATGDAASDMIAWGALTAIKSVGDGDAFQFPVSDVDIALD